MQNREDRRSFNTDRFNPPEVEIPEPEDDLGAFDAVSEMLGGLDKFNKLLEEYRKNIGRHGHHVRNFVSKGSKAAIRYTKRKERDQAEEVIDELYKALEHLRTASLPSYLRKILPDRFVHALPYRKIHEFLCSAGQEVVEAHLFYLLWPVVLGEEDEVPPLPSLAEFNLPHSTVVAGIQDVETELGKAVEQLTRQKDTPSESRRMIRDRAMKVIGGIHEVVERARSGVPGSVIDNHHHHSQSVRKKGFRVQGMLAGMGEQLEAQRDRAEQSGETLL